MPIILPHIIRKQYLHVELNGTESDGLALQRSLSGLCQHWLMPAIERVLNRLAPRYGHLFIERLEIDAGIMTLEGLERDFVESVAHALEKSLREHMPAEEFSEMAISENIRLKTANQSINEALLYFLRYGSLPWSFRLPDGATMEKIILDSWQEAVKSGVEPLCNEMLHVLAEDAARKRLVRQFSPALLETLLSMLSPEGKRVMDGVLEALRSSSAPSVDRKYFEKLLWEKAFAKLAENHVLKARDIVTEAWCVMPFTAKGDTELKMVLEFHWPDITNRTQQQSSGFDKNSIVDEHSEDSEKIFFEPTAENLPESDKKSVRDIHPDVEEGIYIENAGLVLLHPFLPRFFTALGIATEDKLLQPERALYLLHFLATGQLIAPEHELILPKILCNVPLETPTESDVTLTPAEQEESTALLESVIHHWDALGNTSPDGLRGTFLLRSGKVSLKGDHWLLQVEAREFDILLDQLPWGIGMIKLPWMEKMLGVEWK